MSYLLKRKTEVGPQPLPPWAPIRLQDKSKTSVHSGTVNGDPSTHMMIVQGLSGTRFFACGQSALACRPLASAMRQGVAPRQRAPCLVAVRALAKGKAKAKGKGKGAANAGDAEEGGAAQVDFEAIKLQMHRPFEHLQREYASMQTGRAVPSLLESVRVDIGGGADMQPLPSLAKVLTQGPQALQVSVYDQSHVNAVAKAIENSPLSLRAEQQGKLLRVNVPRPTQE